MQALSDGLLQGDPAADAVVVAFGRLPGGAGWRALDAALAGEGGAVPEVDALLDAARTPPAWVDLDRVDRGATAYWRVGATAQLLALTYGSLAFGYQSDRLARPLAATGRLEAMATRRLAETSQWVVAATGPGAMHPGAAGWTATIHVRLVHALVRAKLRRAPWWDHEAFGEPISATDGFATAIGGFCVIPMVALRDLGVRFSAAEEEALVALWAWIGFVMGVPEALLPRDAAQAHASVEAVLAMNDGPNEDGPPLMRALLARGLPFQDRVPGPVGAAGRAVGARVAAGFARRWMEGSAADRLAVPRLTPAPLVPVLRPAQWARDPLRRLVGDERLARAEHALARRVVAQAPPVPVGAAVEAAPLARA